MEPSKEAIAVRITRLNRQILGKVTSGVVNKFNKRTIDREALLDALTVLYDDCNDDPIKKTDNLVRVFVDKYRSTLAELRRTRVCIADFDIIQTIGRGHFGEVHMVREKQTGDVYALKTVKKELARKRVSGAEDERDILANANVAWIPKLQYAFQDNTNLYLVMELCSGGDLAGLISRRVEPLSERDAAFYVAEIANALKALHGMGYVHRDVKPHNVFLDRCGHIKLGDFGSCARLSDGGSSCPGAATADYVAPELLAAADCAADHAACMQCCKGITSNAISACDYWSLGVIAFELVTLQRPFSSGDDDSVAHILANIQKYERSASPLPPFPAGRAPSRDWCSLVSGLLAVLPSKRSNYLDTMHHPALAHLSLHAIREQSPAWMPHLRGSEDASYFSPAPRLASPPDIAAFRTRPPFAGQLPFVGYSYVACEDSEDHSSGFNASHDCTAIDLATFKSAEKLAAMRAREISALQNKLAAAEEATRAAAERGRRAEDEHERARARLQAEITALTLQNKRLERQIEIEREERMALQRTNQELTMTIAQRNSSELQAAKAQSARAESERDMINEDLKRLEAKVTELQEECSRAMAEADAARQQQKHYKDTIAKERALRRQTLSGGEAESREFIAKISAAEANIDRERTAREAAEKRLIAAETESGALRAELEEVRRELASAQESLSEMARVSGSHDEQLRKTQQLLSQERVKTQTLTLQIQELERNLSEACARESTLEEQSSRTEARLRARLEEAETDAADNAEIHARHREKVNTLEQLVRQLEREVSALEKRSCPECEARALERDGDREMEQEEERRKDAQSDTESVGDAASVQLMVVKEQLERAEAQLQARADELATLRQETRTANLARWRKEREYTELQAEFKSSTRDLKRVEERLTVTLEAKKNAEQKLTELQKEMAILKPEYERVRQDADRYKEKFDKLSKIHETAQAEVDRSRNDIRKLKSELQYSEKRRLHAEEQEELSTRERCQLRDELAAVRAQNNELIQNNKALQEACTMLEDQLTDLEKLADVNEIKNKDLESEMLRLRTELDSCRSRLSLAERGVAERSLEAALVSKQHDQASEQAKHAFCQVQILNERLEHRECQISELEARVAELETERTGVEAALNSAMRRVRDLQEENSSLRTRSHEHHSHAMQLQANLAEVQEELSCAREASETAAAWWRTRETKADATLRQQAKLIDFLQAKVEDMGRKKHSLGNKLFGRSGRRPANSPPLRKANRELREEVERLRARLAGNSTDGPNFYCPSTPKRELATPKSTKKNSIVKSPTNSIKNTSSSNRDENNVLVVWGDGTRESMQANCSSGGIELSAGDKTLRGRLLSTEPKNVPYNESHKAFAVKLENGDATSELDIVCEDQTARCDLIASLSSGVYEEVTLRSRDSRPLAALCVAVNAVAIGYSDGLQSARGAVSVILDPATATQIAAVSSTATQTAAVSALAAVCGRALMVYGGVLVHTGLLSLGSAVRRASSLHPSVNVDRVRLPDVTQPHLIKVSTEESASACCVVACGRRVFVLRWAPDAADFKIARSLTVDRPPSSLLLVKKALYIAGEKPLKINLPSGALETFATEEPTVAAAAKKHSPPMAILLIQENPIEILLCYAECGIFVDENGKRSRSEDPKWTSAVKKWEFVKPFLYLIGDEKITILYITDEVYRAPPCTCDTTSMTSAQSESYSPQIFTLKLREPDLLGTVPNGIIISTKSADGYSVSVVEGLPAFKSIGASVESLVTSSSRGSTSSINDYESERGESEKNDLSQESVEATTGFLADIRKRAKQLRQKNKNGPMTDEVIKEILKAEVGLKTSNGRKSPASITDSETDTETENKTYTTKGTADVCGEMFARQVRFQ